MRHNNERIHMLYAIVETPDGLLQIVIKNGNGEVLGNTPKFQRSELRDYLSVFFNIEVVAEDTIEFNLKIAWLT